MPTHPIDTTDITRPDGVEGRMYDNEIVYDKASDSYKLSQVKVWIDYKIGEDVVDPARPLTLSPGLIQAAVDKAYDVALAEEVAAQKVAHPEYTDEEAMTAAQAEVTRSNPGTIWDQLRTLVLSLESEIADQRTANPGYTDLQVTVAAQQNIADLTAQTLLAKDTGAQSWGIRLLKYAYNSKGI